MRRPILSHLPSLGIACVLLAACVSTTPVQPAPLPADEQEQLRCDLLGSWRLVAIDGEPHVLSAQTWTFRADGSGVYRQTGMVSGSQPFQWRLDGRNILLSGSMEIAYRADTIQTGSMVWFNYTNSDEFSVERTAEGTGCEGTATPLAPETAQP